jgi:ABC-2 type transport system ATP-binding protein
MIVPFGTRLHVSGTDAKALEATMQGLARRHGANAALEVRTVEPGLEDVFIHMMRKNAPGA